MKRLIQNLALMIAVGPRAYQYMARTLAKGPDLHQCHYSNILYRFNGRDIQVEADWLKQLQDIVAVRKRPKPMMNPYAAVGQGMMASGANDSQE